MKWCAEPFNFLAKLTYNNRRWVAGRTKRIVCVCVFLNQGAEQRAIETKPITMRVLRWMYAHILYSIQFLYVEDVHNGIKYKSTEPSKMFYFYGKSKETRSRKTGNSCLSIVFARNERAHALIHTHTHNKTACLLEWLKIDQERMDKVGNRKKSWKYRT